MMNHVWLDLLLLRVYYKGLEYNTASVKNSLVSTTLFIPYTFGTLLFRPILEAEFFRSQIKLEIILLHLAKKL